MVSLKQTTIGGITGSRTLASLEQIRLEAGLPGWLADRNFESYQALTTASWLDHYAAWQFAHHRFKIEIRDSEAKLQGRRTNDGYRMFEFATSISMDARHGGQDPSCGADYESPRVQAQLYNSNWSLWQNAPRLCLLSRGSSRFLQTALALGWWHRFPTRWQLFYSAREERIYTQERCM